MRLATILPQQRRGWWMVVGVWLLLVGLGLAATTTWAAPATTATITIVLEARPAVATNLGFSGSLGIFLLDAPAVDDGDGITNTQTFTVTAGTYTVQRNNPLTWFTTAIRCSPTGNAVIDLPQRRAILTVATGDQLTCTFTVEREARIVARAFQDQVRIGANQGRRNVNDPWQPDWPMTVFTAPTATVATRLTQPTGVEGLYEAFFRYLPAGNYTLCTNTPGASWTPTTPTAVDPAYGQLCKNVTLTPGQQATLLFGAYPAASAAVAPLIDNGSREDDLILDLPYDPTEDALLLNQRLFLPLAPQTR